MLSKELSNDITLKLLKELSGFVYNKNSPSCMDMCVYIHTSSRSGPSTSLARMEGLLEDTWLCWTASLPAPSVETQNKNTD